MQRFSSILNNFQHMYLYCLCIVRKCIFFNDYVYFSLHDQKKFAWIFHDFLWIFINFQFIFMEIPWFLMDFHGFSQIFNNFHWICKGFHRFLTISSKCTFIFYALSGNVFFFNVYVYFSLHDPKKFAWIFYDFLWFFIDFQCIFIEIPWFLIDVHGFSQIFNNFLNIS